ncbi:hypothetical protein SAMN04487955_1222 [Halomonas korlensis]|uniref:Uncharacterized protein n=1 Tax=Halomonas korlensis TaxID=463301 RepID=A0A1I7KIY1_9GAMM|nr:hypothetical protein SAMN04487955_1222 [Halomonas korlensis]
MNPNYNSSYGEDGMTLKSSIKVSSRETLHKSHRSCLIAIGGVEFDPPTTV